MGDKKRCKWCNLKNPLYVDYHGSVFSIKEKVLEKLMMILI